MPKITGLFLAVLIGVMAQLSRAQGQQDSWVLLKTETIDYSSNAQIIEIPSELPRVYAVRLRVPTGKLQLQRIIVTYGNGQQHFEERAIVVGLRQQSSPIGTREDGLVIDSVALTFQKSSLNVPTIVQVWGKTLPEEVVLSNHRLIRRDVLPPTLAIKGYREMAVLFGTSRQREMNLTKNNRQLATFSGE